MWMKCMLSKTGGKNFCFEAGGVKILVLCMGMVEYPRYRKSWKMWRIGVLRELPNGSTWNQSGFSTIQNTGQAASYKKTPNPSQVSLICGVCSSAVY